MLGGIPLGLEADPDSNDAELSRWLSLQGWIFSQTPVTTAAARSKTRPTSRSGIPTRFGTSPALTRTALSTVLSGSRPSRLKNFFPTDWHREHQIVYVKADLLKVAGRVPGAVAIESVPSLNQLYSRTGQPLSLACSLW